MAVICSLSLFSCDDDDAVSTTDSIQVNISGLEDLGSDYVYEGWLIVDGAPVTAGIFTVDSDGNLSDTSFELDRADIEAATTYVLTIEPSIDSDPAPSSTHVLAGDFSATSAAITVDHAAALGESFSAVSGDYILATPTDDDADNEDSGIWFLNNSSGSPVAGLSLPELPEGWAYEGWVVINGTPVTTGTFTSAEGVDSAASYSGVNPGPPYPGEDFLTNAPAGLSFPTSITGGTAVISIEPVPDNSQAPFTLKPLVGAIPVGAEVHSVLSMEQNLSFPTGTINR